MGYQTSHELRVIKGDAGLISKLREVCEDASYAIDDNGDLEESCKWYSHQDDIKRFSANNPEALFMLSGEGEEAGDLWREYYQDGKMQIAKGIVTYPKFDEKALT